MSPEMVAHKPRILLLTPPPVDEYQQVIADQARGFDQIRRIAENTKLYAETCREVGSQLKVPVVDIWKSFLQHAGWIEGQEHLPGSREIPANETLQSLLSDGDYSRGCVGSLYSYEVCRRQLTSAVGLHLTPSGYKLVYEEVMKSIKANYPEIDPDKMPFKYPPWEQAPRRRRKESGHAMQ